MGAVAVMGVILSDQTAHIQEMQREMKTPQRA
jgi:hypothetical protein